MATTTTAQHTALEQKTALYLQKLEQIDRLLQGPVETLLRQAHNSDKAGRFEFPALISDRADFRESPSPSTKALCIATLQKLARLRSRFPWLEKNSKFDEFSTNLMVRFRPSKPSDFWSNLEMLQSTVFGDLNPLTASYVFHVLLEAGEAEVHCGLGFLALFAMLWPLHRHFPDSLSAGSRIEPWEPTAYVTANCLLPLRKVLKITAKRADLLEAIKKNLTNLHSKKNQPDNRSRWLFNRELDTLCANLLRLSKFTVVGDKLSALAENVRRKSAAFTVDCKSPNAPEDIYEYICTHLAKAINTIGTTSYAGIRQAKRMLDKLRRRLLSFLDKRPTNPDLTPPFDLRFSNEHAQDLAYWKDLYSSAEQSLDLCQHLLKLLAKACRPAKNATFKTKRITAALEALIDANRNVNDHVEKTPWLEDAARWCRTIMDREIAHAAAGNHTDFDPSELVSAIAVAVQWRLISTELQVSDAVSKALLGTREDGSWKLGLPFFSLDDAQGIWPVTSESVWTLTGALQQYPEVNVADTKLFLYLDWLESTQRTFSREKERYSGWPSDRLRHSHRIHLATTAFSINALLEIRDLVEFRLWQLCQERFTCASPAKGLDAIDPVDLGAKHEYRTHGLLAGMVADTTGVGRASAVYSLILHGPPGSSKTKVAEGLSAEMWKDCGKWGSTKTRFIRITPADFTRLGEERLDSEARLIFELLSHIRGVTIFFDEIDDLLHRRNTEPNNHPTFMALVVPAMLNRLADLRDACPRQEICFLLATNYVEHIEPALIRPGRIDHAQPVVYPDNPSRDAMLLRHLDSMLLRHFKDLAVDKEKPASRDEAAALTFIVRRLSAKLGNIVKVTNGLPWMVIEKVLKDLLNDAIAEKKQEKLVKAIIKKQKGVEISGMVDKLCRVHIEKIIECILKKNKLDGQDRRYGDRWETGSSSREFLDEVVHYHFAHDVNIAGSKEDLLLAEFKTLEKPDPDGLETLYKRIQIVAETEGRVAKRTTKNTGQRPKKRKPASGKKRLASGKKRTGTELENMGGTPPSHASPAPNAKQSR
jgi:hypothetical protein